MAKKSQVIKAKRLQQKSKYPTRVYNRCQICGRRRAYLRRFKLCRICFRRLAHKGHLPGVVKASW